ncbi:hypothetical protein Hamer_G024214, partial [Homarus americanus]
SQSTSNKAAVTVLQEESATYDVTVIPNHLQKESWKDVRLEEQLMTGQCSVEEQKQTASRIVQTYQISWTPRDRDSLNIRCAGKPRHHHFTYWGAQKDDTMWRNLWWGADIPGLVRNYKATLFVSLVLLSA